MKNLNLGKFSTPAKVREIVPEAKLDVPLRHVVSIRRGELFWRWPFLKGSATMSGSSPQQNPGRLAAALNSSSSNHRNYFLRSLDQIVTEAIQK